MLYTYVRRAWKALSYIFVSKSAWKVIMEIQDFEKFSKIWQQTLFSLT